MALVVCIGIQKQRVETRCYKMLGPMALKKMSTAQMN